MRFMKRTKDSPENGASGSQANGDGASSDNALSKIASFKFKMSARKSSDGASDGTVAVASEKPKDLNSALFRQLPEQLQEQSQTHDHLMEYLNTIPIDEIGVPEYYPRLTPNPPKDTDGRREGSGRGWVRELQGRWPGVLG